MGVPTSPGRQSSTACTWYVAGGMPLAFMQEDFLVPSMKARNVVVLVSLMRRLRKFYLKRLSVEQTSCQDDSILVCSVVSPHCNTFSKGKGGGGSFRNSNWVKILFSMVSEGGKIRKWWQEISSVVSKLSFADSLHTMVCLVLSGNKFIDTVGMRMYAR